MPVVLGGQDEVAVGQGRVPGGLGRIDPDAAAKSTASDLQIPLPPGAGREQDLEPDVRVDVPVTAQYTGEPGDALVVCSSVIWMLWPLTCVVWARSGQDILAGITGRLAIPEPCLDW